MLEDAEDEKKCFTTEFGNLKVTYRPQINSQIWYLKAEDAMEFVVGLGFSNVSRYQPLRGLFKFFFRAGELAGSIPEQGSSGATGATGATGVTELSAGEGDSSSIQQLFGAPLGGLDESEFRVESPGVSNQPGFLDTSLLPGDLSEAFGMDVLSESGATMLTRAGFSESPSIFSGLDFQGSDDVLQQQEHEQEQQQQQEEEEEHDVRFAKSP